MSHVRGVALMPGAPIVWRAVKRAHLSSRSALGNAVGRLVTTRCWQRVSRVTSWRHWAVTAAFLPVVIAVARWSRWGQCAVECTSLCKDVTLLV